MNYDINTWGECQQQKIMSIGANWEVAMIRKNRDIPEKLEHRVRIWKWFYLCGLNLCGLSSSRWAALSPFCSNTVSLTHVAQGGPASWEHRSSTEVRNQSITNSTPPLLASMGTGQTIRSVFISSLFCCRSGWWVVLLVPQFKTLIGLNRFRSCWNQLRWERRSFTRGVGGGGSPRGGKWQMYMEIYHDLNNSSVKVISMK